MILYLVRHAFAGEHGDPRYPDDSLRPVTRKGRKRFLKLARQLDDYGIQPRVVGTSPYVRCRQTADALLETLSQPFTLQVVDTFAPGCDVNDLLAWTSAAGEGDLAYVGHAPDIDAIAAAVLGAKDGAIRMAKGAVAAIEFDAQAAAGKGTLNWLVTPKLL